MYIFLSRIMAKMMLTDRLDGEAIMIFRYAIEKTWKMHHCLWFRCETL